MLKSEIQKGYYVNIMLKPFPEKEWTHEIVLYGYDDHNRVFKAVDLENHMFQKRDYSYKFFEDTLPVMQKDFLEKQGRGVGLSMQFQYPICAFKLREDYCAEGCTFQAYEKSFVTVEKWVNISLKYELTGNQELLKTILRWLFKITTTP